MDMETVKIFFDVETPQEEAYKIIADFDPKAEIHNFYSKLAIGANLKTFAVVTMSLEKSRSMQSRFKVEELQDMYYRPSNAPECEGCGCGNGGCP